MATLAARIDRPAPVAAEQQGLALTYQRLMLVMLLFVGVTLRHRRAAGHAAALHRPLRRVPSVANPLLPPRGDIVDRNGVPLAQTIDAWSIARPPAARSSATGASSPSGSRVLMPEHNAAAISRDAEQPRQTSSISRAAPCPSWSHAVNALGEPAIVFAREPERLYPQTEMAGHVLGWTDRRAMASPAWSGCSTRA